VARLEVYISIDSARWTYAQLPRALRKGKTDVRRTKPLSGRSRRDSFFTATINNRGPHQWQATVRRKRYSSRCSRIMQTAHSRTSAENLFDLFMAPFSRELEPPPGPERFNRKAAWLTGQRRSTPGLKLRVQRACSFAYSFSLSLSYSVFSPRTDPRSGPERIPGSRR
jgi:hypothetical protein